MSMSFYFKHRFGFVTSQLQFEDLFWWLKEVKREKDDNPFFGKPIPLPDLTVHQTCKKPSACNIATSSFLTVSSSSSNEKNALWRPFFDVQAGFGHSIKTNRKKNPCLWLSMVNALGYYTGSNGWLIISWYFLYAIFSIWGCNFLQWTAKVWGLSENRLYPNLKINLSHGLSSSLLWFMAMFYGYTVTIRYPCSDTLNVTQLKLYCIRPPGLGVEAEASASLPPAFPTPWRKTGFLNRWCDWISS